MGSRDDAEALLVCRSTHTLRILLAATLGPVFWLAFAPAREGSVPATIAMAITGGILAWFWIGDPRRQARIFRDRVEVDTLLRTTCVGLSPTTEYYRLVHGNYVNLVRIGTNHQIGVHDGEASVRLHRMTRLDEAIQILRDIERKDVLPAASVRIEQGAEMNFGPLALVGDRVRHRGEEVRVSDLTDFQIKKTTIELWLPDERLPWAYEGIQSIPNIDTFVELIRRRLRPA